MPPHVLHDVCANPLLTFLFLRVNDCQLIHRHLCRIVQPRSLNARIRIFRRNYQTFAHFRLQSHLKQIFLAVQQVAAVPIIHNVVPQNFLRRVAKYDIRANPIQRVRQIRCIPRVRFVSPFVQNIFLRVPRHMGRIVVFLRVARNFHANQRVRRKAQQQRQRMRLIRHRQHFIVAKRHSAPFIAQHVRTKPDFRRARNVSTAKSVNVADGVLFPPLLPIHKSVV